MLYMYRSNRIIIITKLTNDKIYKSDDTKSEHPAVLTTILITAPSQRTARIRGSPVLKPYYIHKKYCAENLEYTVDFSNCLNFIPLISGKVCSPYWNCGCLAFLDGVTWCYTFTLWSLPVNEEKIYLNLELKAKKNFATSYMYVYIY